MTTSRLQHELSTILLLVLLILVVFAALYWYDAQGGAVESWANTLYTWVLRR